MSEFQAEVRRLINYYSLENGSSTPDFILAEYLVGCLELWNKTAQKREDWHGRPIPDRDEPIELKG